LYGNPTTTHLPSVLRVASSGSCGVLEVRPRQQAANVCQQRLQVLPPSLRFKAIPCCCCPTIITFSSLLLLPLPLQLLQDALLQVLQLLTGGRGQQQ
jgi:hypothetical protein